MRRLALFFQAWLILLSATSVAEAQLVFDVTGGPGSIQQWTIGGVYNPYTDWYWTIKNQYFVRASDMQAAGMPPGLIVGVAVLVRNVPSGMPARQMTVKFGLTSLTQMPVGWNSPFPTGLTEVYSNPSFVPQPNQWNVHMFSTPIQWDGQSNVLIEFCSYRTGYSSRWPEFWMTTTNPPVPSLKYRWRDLGNWCSMTTGYTSTYHNRRPVFRFFVQTGITESFPDDVDPRRILRSGEVYDGSDAQHPHPYLKFRTSPGQQLQLTYKIVGPLPSLDPIYIAHEAGNPNDTILNYTATGSGEVIFEIPAAKGTAAGQNGALDLSNIPGGSYRLIASYSMPGYTQEWVKDFIIAYANDMSVREVVSPYTNDPPRNFKYPQGVPIDVVAKFQNVGLNTVTEFEVVAKIWKDGTLLYEARDTIRNANMATGDVLSYDFPAFSNTQQVGLYDLQICVNLLKAIVNGREVAVQDQQAANDCVPKAGETYRFEVQYDVEIGAVGIEVPANGESYCVNRPMRPVGVFANYGISDQSNVPVRMTIYKLPQRQKVYESNVQVESIPVGEVPVPQLFDLFTPTEAGQYEAVIESFAGGDGNSSNNSTSVQFTVSEGLSGTYQVGVGRDYATIQDAVDALYSCSVSGPVVFELTDAEYEVGDINALDAAALDLRGTIIGVSEENTVTFRPSAQRAASAQGVTIRLNSGNGIGIWFGQMMFPQINNPNSILSELMGDPDYVELYRQYSKPSGYVIFDGTDNRALKLQLATNSEFRSVVYLGSGASNYTIKNCVIEPAPGQPNRFVFHTSLPQVNFNPGTLQFEFEKDARYDQGETITYTAGVVLRSVPPMNRQGNNGERLDTLVNEQNVIEGNRIHGFGYGIVSLGIGPLFRSSEFVEYANRENVIRGNAIWHVKKAGIWMGNESGSRIEGNRIWNVAGAEEMAAGIGLGGYGLYTVSGLEVVGNEISGVSSDVYAAGIAVVHRQNRYALPSGGEQVFPQEPSGQLLANNVVWGLSRGQTDGSVVGIHVTTVRQDWWTPQQPSLWVEGTRIYNNTVVVGDDNVQGSGVVGGIVVQQQRSAQVKNNVMMVRGGQNSDYVNACLVYEGLLPSKEGGLESNWNGYDASGGMVAYLVEVDESNQIVEQGWSDQFEELEQWQAWTGQDNESVEGNFWQEHELVGDAPYRLRIKSNPTPLGSKLNNRGEPIGAVSKDIDGEERGVAGNRPDIGADEFAGRLYLRDMSVEWTLWPRSYKPTRGQWSEAHYVVVDGLAEQGTKKGSGAEISGLPYGGRVVRALIRNTGAMPMYGITAWCRVYRQLPDGSWQKEVEQSRVIGADDGESVEVVFDFDGRFMPKTYSELSGYEVPAEFRRMERNVTPLYKVEVEVESDNDYGNNRLEKVVRYYVRKAENGWMVSIRGGWYTDDELTDGQRIAGRLNVDSLEVGLERMGAMRYEEGDYDVLDRGGWSPYGLDLQYWRMIWWSGDESGLNRREREAIRRYLAGGSVRNQKNIAMAGQQTVKDDDSREFLKKVLRVEEVMPGTPVAGGYDGKRVKREGMKIREVVKATGYDGDSDPMPALLGIYSDAETEGVASVIWRYEEVDQGVGSNVMGVGVDGLKWNGAYLGVEWRHFGKDAREKRSGIERVLRSLVDYFDQVGGNVSPVEIVKFEGWQEGEEVVLRWEVADEQEIVRYEVERMGEGKVIGEVIADGRTEYEVRDEVEGSGVYRYRLRVVEADGSWWNGGEVEVVIGGAEAGSGIEVVRVEPLPVRVEGEVVYRVVGSGEVEVEVYDMSGKVVKRWSEGEVGSGEHRVRIGAGLSSGVYVVVLRQGQAEARVKVEVVR